MNEQLMRHPMYKIIDGLIDDLGLKDSQIDHQEIVQESIDIYLKSFKIFESNNTSLGEDQLRELALDDLKSYLKSSYH